MVIKTKVDFDTTVYNQIEANIRELPRKYQKQFLKDTRRPVENLRRRMKRQPRKRGSEQFIWSHNKAKQGRAQRWWFAAIAGKIPGVTIRTDGKHYRRSGKLLKNVNIKLKRNEILVEFPDAGIYVIWKQQVPGHKRTGWKRLDKELEKAEVQMSDTALASWDKITDEVLE